ncbi:hypothetical protein M3Y97_00043900 [Aphelenchoides bicaudatus]|nr:hypothetical protein M3Y97_00043900 [Aphelenchoides bicaudatus]
MTDLDETALLGGDLGSDQLFTGDIIDEDELLGLNDQKSQNSANGDNAPAPVLNTSISNEETEQLDYDEDDETEKKPRDKFSSEKKQENFGTDNPNNQKSGAKCFVNPKFQNRLPNSGNSQSPLPSLMSQTIPPPMPQMMPNPVDYNVRMVMMNSLRPIVPPNPMMRPMGLQGFPMQNPGMPPMSMPNQPPGPITAQIGQLSTVIQQQQDGTITFRTTIPQNQPPRVTIARAGCSEQGPNKDWDSMVDEFIKGGSSKSRKRERRSRSNSSKSRSISNSSYSGSYTGDSYSSRSDYSRSPSPYRRRRNRSPDRKRRSHRHGSYRRHRHERTRRSPRRHRDSKNDLKNTMECAEAVGLDSEYVRKLEEQKKLREEVARQKYQRDGRAAIERMHVVQKHQLSIDVSTKKGADRSQMPDQQFRHSKAAETTKSSPILWWSLTI